MLILFWFCVDDTLAGLLGIPGLGHLPLWLWGVLVLFGLIDGLARVAT